MAASEPQPRSPLIAAVLSFLWPGLGQLYARRFLAAVVFAVPALVALAWLLWQLSNGVDWFAASFLDSSFALTIVLGSVALGLWRLLAVVHAFGQRRPHVRESAVLAVLLALVLAVHAEAAYYSWSFYSFDVDVTSNVLIDNGPVATPSGAATATQSPTAIAWNPGSSNAIPTQNPDVTTSLPPHHHTTILLAGMDWLPDRTTAMMDAQMVVSLDNDSHKVSAVSFPRDTAYFDYYWGGRTGVNTKINNFATLVSRRQIPAPDPPLTALAKEDGFLLGIDVDYYAVIDLSAFGSLVDAAGGVCLDNPKVVHDPTIGAYFGVGRVCLNGGSAILYVRARHGGGNDYLRAARQQLLLEALAKKLASPSGIGRLPRVLSLASKVIQTNFPLNTVRDYVSLIGSVGSNDISRCVLGPPYNYHPATSLSRGAWTTRLLIPKVAGLSVHLYGTDSHYYGMEGITPEPCPGQ